MYQNPDERRINGTGSMQEDVNQADVYGQQRRSNPIRATHLKISEE